MPDMDGAELVERIRRHPDLTQAPKIILVTAYGWDESAGRAEELELEGFLVKPIDKSVLLDTIMGVLDREIEYKYFYISVSIIGRERFATIFFDITERKKSEEALRATEERFKHLVESVTNYIYAMKVEDGYPVAILHGPGCAAVTGFSSLPVTCRDQ
jgi:CheY-like chemotaxis protein